jgi:hypothetical protein
MWKVENCESFTCLSCSLLSSGLHSGLYIFSLFSRTDWLHITGFLECITFYMAKWNLIIYILKGFCSFVLIQYQSPRSFLPTLWTGTEHPLGKCVPPYWTHICWSVCSHNCLYQTTAKKIILYAHSTMWRERDGHVKIV